MAGAVEHYPGTVPLPVRRSFDHQFFYLGFQPDDEIGPVHGRTQEGLGGIPAPAGALIDFEVTYALVVTTIEIFGSWYVGFNRGIGEGFQNFPSEALLAYSPLAAMTVCVREAGRSAG